MRVCRNCFVGLLKKRAGMTAGATMTLIPIREGVEEVGETSPILAIRGSRPESPFQDAFGALLHPPTAAAGGTVSGMV